MFKSPRFKIPAGLRCLAALGALALVINGCDNATRSPKTPDAPAASGTPASPSKPADGAPAPAASPAESASSPAAASGAPSGPVAGDPGSLSGKVVFSGAPPARLAIREMDGTIACKMLHATPVLSQEVIVNANGTLKNVFVYIKKGMESQKFTPPAEPVVFDQRGCMYEPHVFGVQVKQTVKILNSDPTNHNIHGRPRGQPEFNLSQPANDPGKTWTPTRKEMKVLIKCDVHGWMQAYCNVLEHPFFSVTNDEGTFDIKNVPPGKYTIGFWHEKYTEQEQEVEIKPKEAKALEATFKG